MIDERQPYWSTLATSFLLTLLSLPANAQQAPIMQPEQTLVLENDTLYWEIPELEIKSYYLFSQMESLHVINNDVMQGQTFTYILKNGKNMVRCPSPKDVKTIYPIRLKKGNQTKQFQAIFWIYQRVEFDKPYIQTNKGKATIEIPEVFELNNIVFSLTGQGRQDFNLIEMKSAYYGEVLRHFKPFAHHPLIDKINGLVRENPDTYLNYRLDSYCYGLEDQKLKLIGRYKNLGYRQYLSDDTALWESFIVQSNFRDFYKQHFPFYQTLISQAEDFLAPKRMWQWLEERFPSRYDSYRIIISPLINGFHNTERFENNGFKECLMFVRDTRRDDPKQYSSSVRSGLYSGIVFTEIDHNYVNPLSDTFKSRIDSVFNSREKWTLSEGDAKHYSNAYSVFNEYMTHALFLLYIHDFYAKEDYQIIKQNRVALMNRRGFHRFASFYEALEELYQAQPKKNVAKLFAPILEWSYNLK